MKIEQEWLQQTIEELAGRFNIPSMQVAVIQNGEVSFAGTGVRDMEKQETADRETLYSIASITKTFAAAAAGLLVDEGLITWDTPIINYLPDLKMYNEALTQGVTVRDLLSHRTGIPRHDRSWSMWRDKLELADAVRNIAFLEPNQPLRHIAQYNNYMFALTSHLVERVTGQAWDEFVSDRLLRPLGMSDTYFRKDDVQEDPNRSKGYQKSSGKWVSVPMGDIYFMGACGCMISSVSDMIKWVQFHLDEGRAGGRQLISSRTIKEMQIPIVAKEILPWIRFPEFSDQSYGICWLIDYYRGRKIVSKSGGLDGYLSDLVLIPQEDFGMISLTNGINHMAIPMLENMVYDQLFGFPDGQWADRYESEFLRLTGQAKQKYEETKKRTGKHVTPRDLQDYTGTYSHPAYGDYTVTSDGGRVMMTYRADRIALDHVIADHFMLLMDSSKQAVPLQFRSGLDGVIHGVSIGFESKISDGIYFRKLE